jgi:hypothetical protein
LDDVPVIDAPRPAGGVDREADLRRVEAARWTPPAGHADKFNHRLPAQSSVIMATNQARSLRYIPTPK